MHEHELACMHEHGHESTSTRGHTHEHEHGHEHGRTRVSVLSQNSLRGGASMSPPCSLRASASASATLGAALSALDLGVIHAGLDGRALRK